MSDHCEDSFLLNCGISQSSEKKSTTTENIKQKEVRPPCFSPCRFFHANLVRLLFLVTRPSRKNKPTKTKLSASAAVAMLENANAIWNEIAKEFMSLVNIEVTGEDLRKVSKVPVFKEDHKKIT